MGWKCEIGVCFTMAANTKNGVHKDADQQTGGGGLRALLAGGSDDNSKNRGAVESLRSEAPTVADILGGIPADAKNEEVLGGTITFFVRDGVMRFTCNVKAAGKTFIGDVAAPLSPWESIESAFVTGKVSSKGYTERRDSYLTDEQKALLH